MSTPDRSSASTGTLWLEAPDWQKLDTVAQRAEPWALWRIGFQSLLAHWMDEAVRRNVERVEIISPDRPAELEAALNGGVFWSREIVVHATRPDHAPSDCESMLSLPGFTGTSPPTDGAGVVKHWLQIQLDWLSSRDETVSVDRQLHPRVWVGPRVSIHPQARLTGPCWIGSQTQIGADSEIGPNAVIGTHSVIDHQASVKDSIVLPDTFIGANLHLQNMIADGNILLDANRGTRVEITDRFMIARLHASIWNRLMGRKKQ